jgi:hypothetical protein
MMQVPVHNEDPFQAMFPDEIARGDSHAVEYAETHTFIALRVVTRGPHQGKPIVDLAGKERVACCSKPPPPCRQPS